MSENLLQKLREKKDELLHQYDKMNELKEKEWIKDYCDLYGDETPSYFFPLLLKKYSYLLCDDDFTMFSKNEIEKRKCFNNFIKKIGYIALNTKQIIVDKNELLNCDICENDNVIDKNEPVIYLSNHSFRQDILGTLLVTDRQAYIMFASLPQFFNTLDGPLLFKNGIVLLNRKIKKSRKTSIDKTLELLKNGCSIIMFPESTWNESPNKIILHFWGGFYDIAKKSGAKIIPVVHYIKDPSLTLKKSENPFYTVIDNPIDISNLSKDKAIRLLEEKFSTWTYLLMEKYGYVTRDELLYGYDNVSSYWENMVRKRIATAEKYDSKIEICADFHDKRIINPEEVFLSIANLKSKSCNVFDVINARELIKTLKRDDFQHNMYRK